jgi:hypothetical protein
MANWCDHCQRQFMGFHQCSAFVPPEVKVPPPDLTPVARLEERPLQREPGSTPGGSSTYRYRDPERRKAYMRNLMRARRGK